MKPLGTVANRKGEFCFTEVKSDEVLRDFITPLLFRVIITPHPEVGISTNPVPGMQS